MHVCATNPVTRRNEPLKPLTAVAHDAVAAALFDGAKAIDATMGNGNDTVFLAQQVGPNGSVIAFDIQSAAVATTACRIEQAGVAARVELRLQGHQEMLAAVPTSWLGAVNAVMFNLGYLPGGDKTCVTQATTTCQALGNAIELLATSGRLSILLYRHHAGADPEVSAVMQWLGDLPDAYHVDSYETRGPALHLVTRVGRFEP